VTIEDRLSRLEELLTTILREQREQRIERQHQGGRWGTRAQAAEHYAVSVDTIDSWIRAGTLRAERRGQAPELKHDSKGRRIDRRRVLVWIAGAPKTETEIGQLATAARA
jgi:hypothetical protein